MNASPHVKPQSNSVIASLPAKKRELLDTMLFEKNLSYRGIAKTSVAKFGVQIHPQSLSRYYRRTIQQRTVDSIIQGKRTANAVVKAFTDNPADTYQAVLGIVGQVAFDKALNSKKELDVRTIRELMSLLISARREDVHTKRYLLSREKWEFDVARACAQHIVDLQAIMADNSVDEDARLHAIRKRLFGDNLPD